MKKTKNWIGRITMIDDSSASEMDKILGRKPPPGPEVLRAVEGARALLGFKKPKSTDGEENDTKPRYKLGKLLGSGGMGAVYLASDSKLPREVAVKILTPDQWVDSDLVHNQLHAEANALASVKHPNIVQIYDVEVIQGRDAVVMEYVPGTNLEAWLKRRRRHYRDVLEVFRKAGRGLAAIHNAKMVHCDFKPANVLINDDPGSEHEREIKVTDFGLAVVADEFLRRARRTESTPEQVAGTIRFMSPEHFAGVPDERSDQFSFCVSLYYALYGESPFEPSPSRAATDEVDGGRLSSVEHIAPASELDEGLAILRGVLRRPTRRSGVPNWVHHALVKGLSRNPENRFSRMEELLEALEDPWEQRLPWIAGALSLVGVLSIGTLSYALINKPEPCEGAGESFAKLWNDERRDDVRKAFVATRLPFAETTADKVLASLDRYAALWRGARLDACESTRVRAEQDDEVMVRRYQCLENQSRNFDNFVATLTSGGSATVTGAIPSLATLAEVSSCSNEAILERTCDLVGRTMPSLRYGEYERELFAGRAAEIQGMIQAAIRHTERAIEIADENNALALKANALVRLGHLVRETEYWRASAVYLDAYSNAEKAGCDALASQAMGGATRAVALNPELSYAKGEEWSRVQESKASREDLSLLHVDALRFRGLLRSLRDEGEESREQARQDFEQALVVLNDRREIPPGRELDRAFITLNLGTVLVDIGEMERGVQLLEESLTLFRDELGTEHPYLHNPLDNLAETLLSTDSDAALKHAEEALRVTQLVDQPSVPLARAHLRMAKVKYHRRNTTAALDHAKRADEIYSKATAEDDERRADPLFSMALGDIYFFGVGDSVRAENAYKRALEGYKLLESSGALQIENALCHARLANVLQARGQLSDARVYSEEGVRLLSESNVNPFDERRAEVELANGEILVKANAPRDARTHLERANFILQQPEGKPALLAWTRWALARSVYEGDREVQRGCELAGQARKWFTENGEGEASHVSDWLLRHCAES